MVNGKARNWCSDRERRRARTMVEDKCFQHMALGSFHVSDSKRFLILPRFSLKNGERSSFANLTNTQNVVSCFPQEQKSRRVRVLACYRIRIELSLVLACASILLTDSFESWAQRLTRANRPVAAAEAEKDFVEIVGVLYPQAGMRAASTLVRRRQRGWTWEACWRRGRTRGSSWNSCLAIGNGRVSGHLQASCC